MTNNTSYPNQQPTDNPKAGDTVAVDQSPPVNHGLGNSGENVQPPSFNAVRPFVPSQPSGGGDLHNNNNNNDGQLPPSFNDIAPRERSQTGTSSSTGVQMSDQQVAGMSLTGNNFRKFTFKD